MFMFDNAIIIFFMFVVLSLNIARSEYQNFNLNIN